jgi:hypothetical protein
MRYRVLGLRGQRALTRCHARAAATPAAATPATTRRFPLLDFCVPCLVRFCVACSVRERTHVGSYSPYRSLNALHVC